MRRGNERPEDFDLGRRVAVEFRDIRNAERNEREWRDGKKAGKIRRHCGNRVME